ncbi:Hypothetical protein DEACI_2498 [Acididesulfobacillus acetoxydans]|uniref:Uncharacterized protein n=1 Tax=Acididesulfobacillus acetoxydans TaxID=1561005 RepID=A0A8S0W8G7_9FIRM|nr:hypothetical protein [Acididesulfobacillus acetoxydans]CAA7601829.1 Hypothetical protein DEACI_2498 [Acididesulfobacillus acetoxydans]CEJ09345.1 Hypothetical protein DEACI_3829 [Acididesulfobacillus acetoxydans]
MSVSGPQPPTEKTKGRFRARLKPPAVLKPVRQKLLRPGSLLILFAVLLVLTASPWLYRESWLSPFSTLGIPNRTLHPHAFTAVGYIPAGNPAHPRFTANFSLTQDLLRDLEAASLVPAAQNPQMAADDPVRHFVLHRASSRFHTATDFALTYDDNSGLVRFGGEYFKVNQATQVLLDSLPDKMQPGWWP